VCETVFINPLPNWPEVVSATSCWLVFFHYHRVLCDAFSIFDRVVGIAVIAPCITGVLVLRFERLIGSFWDRIITVVCIILCHFNGSNVLILFFTVVFDDVLFFLSFLVVIFDNDLFVCTFLWIVH
jgi:hypothetical protein